MQNFELLSKLSYNNSFKAEAEFLKYVKLVLTTTQKNILKEKL